MTGRWQEYIRLHNLDVYDSKGSWNVNCQAYAWMTEIDFTGYKAPYYGAKTGQISRNYFTRNAS